MLLAIHELRQRIRGGVGPVRSVSRSNLAEQGPPPPKPQLSEDWTSTLRSRGAPAAHPAYAFESTAEFGLCQGASKTSFYIQGQGSRG